MLFGETITAHCEGHKQPIKYPVCEKFRSVWNVTAGGIEISGQMSRGVEALQTRMLELIIGVWQEELQQAMSNLPIQTKKCTACEDGHTTHTLCVEGQNTCVFVLDLQTFCVLHDYVVICTITSSIIYLLIYSVEHSPSWKANRFSVKKFPTCYGNRRFINACTSARHLFLSWAS